VTVQLRSLSARLGRSLKTCLEWSSVSGDLLPFSAGEVKIPDFFGGLAFGAKLKVGFDTGVGVAKSAA
jgi:hypothetical protein